MKKLILTPKPEVMYKHELDQISHPLLGCYFGGEKIFFVNENHRSKKYFARLVTNFRSGDGYGDDTGRPINYWLEFFPKEKTEWFVFDDSKDLFKWLSE